MRMKTLTKDQVYYRRHKAQRLELVRQMTAERSSALATLKLELGCIDCGYDINPRALEFDHVTGVKLFNMAKAARMSWDRIFAELEKCVVRCANCHAVKTAGEL